MPGPDPKVLDALLHTLRYDNSVDVRFGVTRCAQPVWQPPGGPPWAD